MSDFITAAGAGRLRTALLLGGLTSLLTAIGGLVLFLAGCLVLGVAPTASYPELVGGPAGLLARGPVGYATWMTLLMAAGSPFVGAGVFAALFFSRS